MNSIKITALTVAAALALAGCAHRPPRDGAIAKKARVHRTRAATPVNPDDAKLVFKSSGMPMQVMYWTSTAEQSCEAFQPVGRVFDSGRRVLLPWIARMTEHVNKAVFKSVPSRVRYLTPGQTIQVKGTSGSKDGEVTPGYSCGPIVTAFTPEKGRSYVVDFDFQGTQSCSQRVTDVTDPEHPAPVGQVVTCGGLAKEAVLGATDKNFLKSFHEHALEVSRKTEAAAASDAQKALAMQLEASALDSLGRSDEALPVIDQALKLAAPSDSKDLIATKAGILFSLSKPQDALALLAPELEKTRTVADSKPKADRAAALSAYTEGFITATFAHIQLEQWQDAIATLADAESVAEGPRFYAYRGLLYRYIMSRAHNPSWANARLEQDATYYAEHDRSHYGALLRLWQGIDTVPEAIKEADAVISGLSGTDRQDALAEEDFYLGAYAKFVEGKPQGGHALLEELDRIAPYGSIEWIYGKRVLE
jgi:tetratricopeptide (TPR) repeat protein